MLIVFLTNRKDYEPFLADVVFGLTPACGCTGAHPGGRRELGVWFVLRISYCVLRERRQREREQERERGREVARGDG